MTEHHDCPQCNRYKLAAQAAQRGHHRLRRARERYRRQLHEAQESIAYLERELELAQRTREWTGSVER